MSFWRKALTIWFLLVLLTLIVQPYTAHAVKLSETGCEQFARLLRATAESRDVGADRDRYIEALLSKNASASDGLRALIRAEVVRVWSSDIAPDDLYSVTLKRCFAARGDIGGDA